MPIYDYHCDHCGHTFSQVQSYADATLEVCPSCGEKPRKLMATPAIVFKGGGWYKTDSRPAQPDGAKASAKDTPKEGPAAPKADGAKSEKGDQKPAPVTKTDTTKADGSKPPTTVPAGPKGDAASS